MDKELNLNNINPEGDLRVSILESINNIDSLTWDSCVPDKHPFVSHAFLSALEESGSATTQTGWLAQHVVLEDNNRNTLGIVPMYLKNHSQGEYVFDHGWAEAFEHAGGQYYPKMQISVPFTPATGPRLLLNQKIDQNSKQSQILTKQLLDACILRCKETGVSSLHVTFPNKHQASFLENKGLLTRSGIQFHWENKGYSDFNEFLESLTSRKRKQIRRERREALSSGIKIIQLSGNDIEEKHWDAFFKFYQETGNRKWGIPYLTREFFSLIGQKICDQIVLMLVEKDSRLIAGALNLKSDNVLYGRNWGSIEYHKFLHFEVCYYKAIDYAIRHQIKYVEAGAQGEHKLIRGYLPTLTYSAHWIANPSFHDAIKSYLEKETPLIKHAISDLTTHAPFKTIFS